jgi:YggT family protein
MILASARTDVAGFLSAVIYVYIILIFAHIVISLLFSAGLRPPYSRALDAVLRFLRDTVEPYLRLFRRLIPPVGGLDLSPTLAIVALYVVKRVLVDGAIHG